MLEEAVSTLKEQVNIYEQEVDQVFRLIIFWYFDFLNIYEQEVDQVIRYLKIWFLNKS